MRRARPGGIGACPAWRLRRWRMRCASRSPRRRARRDENKAKNLIVVKPTLGFTLPSAGGSPAPAVRRRENLRSASFRDYAMEEPLARGLLILASRANGQG